MIDVVIPYIDSSWKYELLYTLRSWEMYFKEDFKITIIGMKPYWVTGVDYIPDFPNNLSERVETGNIHKRRIAHWIVNKNTPFIYTHDDTYLLQDVSLKDINVSYFLQDLQNSNRPKKAQTCIHRLWNTLEKCAELGLHKYNFQTHLPYYYEPDLLIKTFDLFGGGDSKPWCTQTAYRSLYMKENEKDSIVNCDTVRFGVYNQRKNLGIKAHHKFLNHDDAGLSTAVKDLLAVKFPTPSRFEKPGVLIK